MARKSANLFRDLPKLIIVMTLIFGIGAVAGIMAYEVVYRPEINLKNTSKISLNNEAKNDTASWKTYENKKYGFTMKYPPVWEVSEETGYNGEKEVNFKYEDNVNHSSRVGVGWMSSYDEERQRNVTFEEMVDGFKKMAKEDGADSFVKMEVMPVIGDIPALNMTASRDGRYMDSNFMIVNNEVLVIGCETDNLDDNVCNSVFKDMLSSFKLIEKIKRAFLGAYYKDVNILSEEEKSKLNLSKDLDYGALIISKKIIDDLKWGTLGADQIDDGIVNGSPAEIAGLEARDVILEANGEKAVRLQEIQDKYAPGDKVKLKVIKNGKEQEINVTLAEFPETLINR